MCRQRQRKRDDHGTDCRGWQVFHCPPSAAARSRSLLIAGTATRLTTSRQRTSGPGTTRHLSSFAACWWPWQQAPTASRERGRRGCGSQVPVPYHARTLQSPSCTACMLMVDMDMCYVCGPQARPGQARCKQGVKCAHQSPPAAAAAAAAMQVW